MEQKHAFMCRMNQFLPVFVYKWFWLSGAHDIYEALGLVVVLFQWRVHF